MEARIKEVQAKIDQNTHLRKKAIELRQILKDRNAQLQCDTQIRESQRYIDYFTEELRRLQTKGSRASFISLQSFHQQQSNESSSSTDAVAKSTATTSTTTSTTTPGSNGAEDGTVLERAIVDSPTQASLQSYFPNTATNTSASTPTSEMAEEDPRKRYTNLGKLSVYSMRSGRSHMSPRSFGGRHTHQQSQGLSQAT